MLPPLLSLTLLLPLADALPVTTSLNWLTKRATSCANSSVAASATYSGNNVTGGPVRLRITNGGAGQSGLIGALAKAYIDYAVTNSTIATSPFQVDWVTGDTTQSINYLQSGDADVAVTYNPQAEYRAGNLSISTRRLYGFRDHFYLLGPHNNTANLSSTDSVFDIFNKLVTTANGGNGTLFLSRYDQSATNIKESFLFSSIGQTPWANPTAKWYLEYPQYPIGALTAASLLNSYTLSDRGTYLTLQAQTPSLTEAVVLYKAGNDTDPTDLLLNPASFLLGGNLCPDNAIIAEGFMDWMILPNGGQKVVSTYAQPGTTEILYTAAPNCTTQPTFCVGW
ncbi:hypothetical protein T439DRAFT_323377 [Meredithblackwellia eburnea MCA 4105]